MMKVNVRTDSKHHFTVPVPYSIIQLGVSLVSSKAIWHFVNKRLAHSNSSNFDINHFLPKDHALLKKQLRLLLREIRSYKGLTLVEVTEKKGTHVKINL